MSRNNQALIKIVDHAIDHNATVATLKSDVETLKSDVAVLKFDVAVLKSDVTVLKYDVAVLKSDVSAIKSDIRRLDAKIDRQGTELRELIQHQAIVSENIERNVLLILDAVIPAQARAEQ